MHYTPPTLPFPHMEHYETRRVMKAIAEAHRYLAELKGIVSSIPNEAILLNTLSLQEAKGSSAVENIVTTHDELYKSTLYHSGLNPSAKEVQDYALALKAAFAEVRKTGLIRLETIKKVQQQLEKNNAGFRCLPGTNLKNARTQEVVYEPPQHPDQIRTLMENLELYINDDDLCDADPLVKMAIIHHQFESIHPFYDGNGRTGRILNILYLVKQSLLNLPVLYLSRYFIHDKAEYYQQLQQVRESGEWEPWLLYIAEGITQTAKQTIELIEAIKELIKETKNRLKTELPKIYSQDLLNSLFSHPYTKIDFLIKDLKVSRITATKYLEQLVEVSLLSKHKIGRNNYYVNDALYRLLMTHN